MKKYPKPPLIEMMKSLYYLYSIGLIQWSFIESKLKNAYNIYEVIIENNRMTCYKYPNKLRGITITSIPI